MAVGVQCFDADGSLIFDNDFSTTIQLGTGHTGTTAGEIVDERIGDNNGWAIITKHFSAYSGAASIIQCKTWAVPAFSFSHNKISWTFNPDSAGETPEYRDVEFIYGVYS